MNIEAKLTLLTALVVLLFYWTLVMTLERVESLKRSCEMRRRFNLAVSEFSEDTLGQGLNDRDGAVNVTLKKVQGLDTKGSEEREDVREGMDSLAIETSGNKNQIADKLINQPKAILYSQVWMRGISESFDLSKSIKASITCQNTLKEGWRSTRTFGTCIRLFSSRNCTGYSLAIYPRSLLFNSENISNPKFSTAHSVGPCLQNEFEFSTFSNTPQGLFAIKSTDTLNEVPDLIDISGEQFLPFAKEATSVTGPIQRYFRHQARTYLIEAHITPSHLQPTLLFDPPSSSSYNEDDYDRDDGSGFVIPPFLGGATNETLNVFHQTLENYVEWSRICKQVLETLRGTRTSESIAKLFVTFQYQNSYPFSTQRPFGFYYHISYSFSNRISYGFLRN